MLMFISWTWHSILLVAYGDTGNKWNGKNEVNLSRIVPGKKEMCWNAEITDVSEECTTISRLIQIPGNVDFFFHTLTQWEYHKIAIYKYGPLWHYQVSDTDLILMFDDTLSVADRK